MLRGIVSGTMLTFLLVSMFTLGFNIQPAEASGTIYIKSDGSVEGTIYIVSSDNITYTFVADINDSIVVERNNIKIDGNGYALQGVGGPSAGNGIYLSNIRNVTIQNINITGFHEGINFESSSYNTVSGNNMTTTGSIDCAAIFLSYSSSSRLFENDITSNATTLGNARGIFLFSSSLNSVTSNNITNYDCGISLSNSTGNDICHNNFINNVQQAYLSSTTSYNVWDDGYPSGGNYWSDYIGLDEKSGINQDLLGNDGIGDASYTIDTYNHDNYPLMQPYNGSHDIGIRDVHISRTIIAQGHNINVTINMTIINYDEQTVTFNFTLSINTTTYEQTLTLSGRSSIPITFTWNTTGLTKGNYIINAYAEPVPDETDIFNNNFTAKVYIGIPGDVNVDGFVDIKDILEVAFSYGRRPGNIIGYNPNLDIDGNDFIDIKDILITALNYGQH